MVAFASPIAVGYSSIGLRQRSHFAAEMRSLNGNPLLACSANVSGEAEVWYREALEVSRAQPARLARVAGLSGSGSAYCATKASAPRPAT